MVGFSLKQPETGRTTEFVGVPHRGAMCTVPALGTTPVLVYWGHYKYEHRFPFFLASSLVFACKGSMHTVRGEARFKKQSTSSGVIINIFLWDIMRLALHIFNGTFDSIFPSRDFRLPVLLLITLSLFSFTVVHIFHSQPSALSCFAFLLCGGT